MGRSSHGWHWGVGGSSGVEQGLIPLKAQLLKASPADIRKVCVCVRMLSENSEPTRWFSQTTPDEHPRRHRLADGQLSSLYAPLPSFSSFGVASVMMCCSTRPASSSAPSVVPEDRVGRKYDTVCIRRLCVHINFLHIFDQTCIVLKSDSNSMMGPPAR